MNIRKNKGINTKSKTSRRIENSAAGITLVALVITIIILLIISGISITGTIRGKDEAEASTQLSELNMVQHAILERYTKAQLTKENLPGTTKENLPGTTIEMSEVQSIIDEMNSISGENISLKGTEYKRLDKDNLKELGITDEENTFIVNYKTGEVINETLKVTKSEKALYIYSKSEN